MKVSVADSFRKAFKGLSQKKQVSVERALKKLMTEPLPTSLKLRRFKGSLDLWIANVDRGDRIIYQMVDDETALLLDVGTHDSTYNKWNRRKR